jgi:uncharacterized RDD family membrane protein YckC
MPRAPLSVAEDFSVYRPAGVVQRWYAITLDLAFFGPLNLLVSIPFTRYSEQLEAYGHSTRLVILSVILKIIPVIIYFVWPTWVNGQTLGKRIVGLKVIRTDWGSQLSFGAVLMREIIGKLLGLALLGGGFLMMLFNRRCQALHDHLSATCVIDYRSDRRSDH